MSADSVAPLNRIDDEKIAELEKLLAQTTPGVWKMWAMEVLADQDGSSNVETARAVAMTFQRVDGKPRTFDGDFICQAHNLAPLLLAEVKAQREQLTEAQAAMNNALNRIYHSPDEAAGILAAALHLERPVAAALGTADQPPKGASE